jgi:4a-hydroxytetrahydrobiopterin dehydratase
VDESEAEGDRGVLRGEPEVVEDPERCEPRRAAHEAVREPVLRRVDELVEAPREATALGHRLRPDVEAPQVEVEAQHERGCEKAGEGEQRAPGRVADRSEERSVRDQVAVRVEVAAERRYPAGRARERAVRSVEDGLQDEEPRREEQLASRELDRGREPCGEAGQHDGRRRHAKRQQREDDEVRERPVERLRDELPRRCRFSGAAKQGMIRGMSTTEGWTERDGALERELVFDSFRDAIAFVDRLADLAESENHHPDIAISYKRVTVRWTTHSAGGITDRDRDLAVRTDELV